MNSTTTQLDGQAWKRLVLASANVVEENADELSRLDAAVGDGDHGVNVATAMRHARSELTDAENLLPGDVLKVLARGFLDEMGGAAGALFGSLFKAMGRSFGDAPETDTAQLAGALALGTDTVIRRGRSEPGDKTMVDALVPAVEAANGAAADEVPIPGALAAMSSAARLGAEETTQMSASRGRAKYAGDQAIGIQDAGATTVAIIFEAWAAEIVEEGDG